LKIVCYNSFRKIRLSCIVYLYINVRVKHGHYICRKNTRLYIYVRCFVKKGHNDIKSKNRRIPPPPHGATAHFVSGPLYYRDFTVTKIEQCTYIMIRYDMVFISCNWVSALWQRSVNLYKNRKETAIYTKAETIHKTIQKHRIHKIEKNSHETRKQI